MIILIEYKFIITFMIELLIVNGYTWYMLLKYIQFNNLKVQIEFIQGSFRFYLLSISKLYKKNTNFDGHLFGVKPFQNWIKF